MVGQFRALLCTYQPNMHASRISWVESMGTPDHPHAPSAVVANPNLPFVKGVWHKHHSLTTYVHLQIRMNSPHRRCKMKFTAFVIAFITSPFL